MAARKPPKKYGFTTPETTGMPVLDAASLAGAILKHCGANTWAELGVAMKADPEGDPEVKVPAAVVTMHSKASTMILEPAQAAQITKYEYAFDLLSNAPTVRLFGCRKCRRWGATKASGKAAAPAKCPFTLRCPGATASSSPAARVEIDEDEFHARLAAVQESLNPTPEES